MGSERETWVQEVEREGINMSGGGRVHMREEDEVGRKRSGRQGSEQVQVRLQGDGNKKEKEWDFSAKGDERLGVGE